MMHSTRGLLDTATILHHLPRSIIGNLMGKIKICFYFKRFFIFNVKFL